MAIHVSPEVNNLLLLLIGERMLQADEDKAYQSHEPYARLGRQLTKLSDLIEVSVVEVGRSLPPAVATRYVRAMNLFIDDNGRNALKDFADELNVVAQGRVETSINITEAKWQIIAEIVRLLIELAVILVMSVFSGGATAGKAAVARAQSRVTILTILDNLMRRTHLMPSLSEAFDEAFTTFAVRLALIAFGPDGRRPHGFDWDQILQDAVFGGITGMFHGAFEGVADRFTSFLRRDRFDDTLAKKFDDDVLAKIDRDVPSGHNNRDIGSDRDTDVTIGIGNGGHGDNNRARNNEFGDGVGDAVLEGAAETAGEFVTVGLFTGTWALSGNTFLTAAGSALFMGTVFAGVAKFGAQFTIHMDAVNSTPLPLTSGGSGTSSSAPNTSHSPGTTPASGTPRSTPTTGRHNGDDTEEVAPTRQRTVSDTEEPVTDPEMETVTSSQVPSSSDGVTPSTPITAPFTPSSPVTATAAGTASASHSAASPAATAAAAAGAPAPGSASPGSSASPVTPSSVAAQHRDTLHSVPFREGENLQVLDVAGDGDCFFTSLLAGLHHQGHGSPLVAMDVQELRTHAADAFEASALYTEMNNRDALDVLVQDVGLADLSTLLGTAPPALSAQQRAEVENRLRRTLYADALRRLAPAPADRAILTDLPDAAVRALQPAYQPTAGTAAQQRQRDTLTQGIQLTELRAEFRRILTGEDTERAEVLWSSLLTERYTRWARENPRLADFRNRPLGALVADSIRHQGMWATPFFDSAPQAVAQALSLNVTVVQHDQDGTRDTPLNAAAGRPLYIHYNGTDHYSAIANSPSYTPSDAAQEEPETYVRPATTSAGTSNATGHADELIGFLRDQPGLSLEQRTLDRLQGLSPAAVSALLASAHARPSATKNKGKNKTENSEKNGEKGKKPNTASSAPGSATSSGSSETPFKQVITHPGYATGDQFGIAAALLGDPNLHVLVNSAPPGTDPRDKGKEIADFYRASGVKEEQIRHVYGQSAKQEAAQFVKDINEGTPGFDKVSNTRRNALSVPVGTGTTWIGNNFSQAVRDKVREGWRMDDKGFPPEDQARVADWLATKGVTVEPRRQVIVLWSRFSGKRGDIHVEHDTSYTGIDQILTSIHDRTKNDPPGPLVIIAGDAKVNKHHRDRYPDMTRRHWDNGLDVHDLTDFWDAEKYDQAGVASWGGDSRVGQMRMYEYLNRQSGGNLKHLGFRSGNLEAMALSGHQVNYLEEEGSIGGDRMAKWHADTAQSTLKTGYERIQINHPPTLSGQIAVATQKEWEKKKSEYGTKATPRQKSELNELERNFKHPHWVAGREKKEGDGKVWKDPVKRGFHSDDVEKITTYLVGPPPAEPTRLVTRPASGTGEIRTLAEKKIPDAGVRGYGLGEDQGLASFTPFDWARREKRYPAVLSASEYADHRPKGRVLTGAPKGVPWRGQAVSFFAGHGQPTQVELALQEPGKDGITTVRISGRELGRYLKRWGGLGPDGRPIVLYSCATGASPTHGGLPVGQHVANVTGRPVFAPTTKAGTALDSSGQVRPILDVESDTGEVVAGQWRLFLPEPSGAALATLAVHAQLHQGDGPLDPFATNRTLQFVRTLRGTTGPDTDREPELLRGLGALERLRWHTAGTMYAEGRMTPELLTRATRGALGLGDAVMPTAAQYREFLRAAESSSAGGGSDAAPSWLVAPVPAPLQGIAGPLTSPDPGTGSASRDPLWDSGKGKGSTPKADKKAQFTKAGPDPDLKKVLNHPGYATGDQFGIAAYLLADDNVHVIVVRDPTNPRDRSADIVAFYRASGIPEGRIHAADISDETSGDAHAEALFKRLNQDVLARQGYQYPSRTKLKDLVLPVGGGTEWVADNFSQDVRDKVRESWKLDDKHFAPEDQARVADWLATKGVTVEPRRQVIVLWSRFSGKRGDIHVEHDTSYTGVDQLLTSIGDRTKNDPPGPLVIIAGDAKVNSSRPDHYPDLVRKHTGAGLDVHDLTDFWDAERYDQEGVASWGGNTRTGQMRLYEFLHRQSGGRLKHLGFRSGNLEAMALSGHQVNYLEEEGSIGGDRMAKWHAGKAKSELKTGYERIQIDRPPTVSGQIAVAVQKEWESKKRLYGKDATSGQKDELNTLAQEFKHPQWVYGKLSERKAAKPYLGNAKKGFAAEDVTTITDALLGPAEPPADSPATGAVTEGIGQVTSGDGRHFREETVPGDGDCFFRSLLDSARHQDPQEPPLGTGVGALRTTAADAFTGTEEYARLNKRDALDELIRDLTTDQLRGVLGSPLPSPSPQDLAAIDARLVADLYRAEPRHRSESADRSAPTDLPLGADRSLPPGYVPDPADAPAAERNRMTDEARSTILRARLGARLAQDTPEAEAAWRGLLKTRYPRWALRNPPLSAVRGRRLGELVADSIRDVSLWNTPFFDYAPDHVAQALDLHLVVVRTDGLPDRDLNPGGARTVHVLYNILDHYSALSPAEAPDTHPTEQKATVTIVAEDDSPRSFPPAAGVPSDGRTVRLYQRGGEPLARLRPPAPPTGTSADDPDFQRLEVAADDVRGLTVGRSPATTWELTPDTLLPVRELGLGTADLAKLFQRIGHRLGPAVTAEAARQPYGTAEKNFGKFRQLARDRKLVTDVRPSNATAARWLHEGKLPKPEEIKAKTLNDLDVHLGAKAEHIGLVGYFSPVLPPDRTGFDEPTWARIEARHSQRLDEFRHLAATMADLAEQDRFHVRDGLVLGRAGDTPDGPLTEITDDHDVFAPATPGGGRPDTPTYEETVPAATHNDMAVMHGAHLYWRAPRSPYSEDLFTKTVEPHGSDGEPLVRLRPENDRARLVHYTPTPGPAVASPPIPRELVWTPPLPHRPEHQHDDASPSRSSK